MYHQDLSFDHWTIFQEAIQGNASTHRLNNLLSKAYLPLHHSSIIQLHEQLFGISLKTPKGNLQAVPVYKPIR